MERITADELSTLARFCSIPEVKEVLLRAADTITEMDKDIAVYEAQIANMQHQHQTLMAVAETPQEPLTRDQKIAQWQKKLDGRL